MLRGEFNCGSPIIFKFDFTSFLESGSCYKQSGHDINVEIWLAHTNFFAHILQYGKYAMK